MSIPAIWVRHLPEVVPILQQSVYARTDAQGRKGIRMRCVPETIRQQRAIEATHRHPHRRKTIDVHGVLTYIRSTVSIGGNAYYYYWWFDGNVIMLTLPPSHRYTCVDTRTCRLRYAKYAATTFLNWANCRLICSRHTRANTLNWQWWTPIRIRHKCWIALVKPARIAAFSQKSFVRNKIIYILRFHKEQGGYTNRSSHINITYI